MSFAPSAPCPHSRVSHGRGAVYECLDCGTSVPLFHLSAMGVVDSAAGQALLAWQEPPCAHARISVTAHAFYQRGPAPTLAHQCLSCGEPVSGTEAARRGLDRDGA